MTMITPSYLGETIEYSSLHACRSTLEDPTVPRQLSPEFLLVDLINELGDLAEDRDAVLSRVREKAKEMDPRKLSRAVSLYGKYSTQKKFQEMLHHAA